MHRVFLFLIGVLVPFAVSAAPIEPQITSQERSVYADMLKTNPAAAKEYLRTREYLSVCRQVVANPQLADDLPDATDDVKYSYMTKDEQAVVKLAIQRSLESYIQKKYRK
jgi:hypothetical protein